MQIPVDRDERVPPNITDALTPGGVLPYMG